MKALFLSFALVLMLLPTSHVKPGAVVLCGGGQLPTEAVELVRAHGPVVVVTCNPEIDRWSGLFDKPKLVLPEDLVKIPIREIGVLILAGGDQWQYLTRLNGPYVQRIHEAGILILGNSAGSMILSSDCFTAERDTISSEEALQGKNVCLAKGFVDICWLRNKIVDTHLRQRGRLGRLNVFVERTKVDGIGIDECTALYVDSNGFKVFGEGGVTMVDYKSHKIECMVCGK